MNRAFIFPGQGAQIVGMGKDFYDNFDEAKSTFKIVDEILNYKLSNIIFNGSNEELTLTTNTQPALMAVSIAILRVIIKQSKKNTNELSSFVAGHSLGEYSALCAAGALSLEDTAKLLHIRGTSMQKAVPQGQGAMAACIGISNADLQELLNFSNIEGVCQIANDNVDGQIVISGHNENIDYMISVLKDTGYKAIKLKVSAPFHSALMKPAEEPMSDALAQTNIKAPLIPLIANVTAVQTTSTDEIRTNLISQICGTVRWRETMNELNHLGVTELVEIGSGKVLSGLAKKTPHNFKITNISTITEMENFLSEI
ncbi:MAG: ACP S-malonyltransferase [Rickettsiaceae bacterium]